MIQQQNARTAILSSPDWLIAIGATTVGAFNMQLATIAATSATYFEIDNQLLRGATNMKNMMQKSLIILGLFCLGLSEPAYAVRTQGPVMTPLKVEKIYLTDSTAVYVSFQAGSMPNCYANRGGYLWKTNPNFDEIYAQLLTIVATNGIRGHVIFDTVNPGAGSWGDCNMVGIHLLPQ